MPRAKHKQELIDTRNATYTELSECCGRCRFYWAMSSTCQMTPAEHRNTRDHRKQVKPFGRCDLFELQLP
jgi:hypothetical protein